LRALALGAADYIPKPETAREATTSVEFRREFIEKIRTLGRSRSSRGLARGPVPGIVPSPEGKQTPALRSRKSSQFAPETGAVQLRPFSLAPPRALLIGSSTGGPQALTALVEKLPAAVDRAPLLITQHMPPTFTTVLAEHLSRIGGRGAHEAEDGEPVLAGGIYVAPGGRHMRVARASDGGIKIALGDDPPINFCKPAVDALFTSAATVWGASSLGLVLTGMGADGTRGAADIVAAGGSVIAQDEASSVVWGMPRSVAQAGLCSAVLPLDKIAPKIIRLFSGDRS
jgi:two-component system, chemotaxis family, protein-glutamate methylesterase/glutaminase